MNFITAKYDFVHETYIFEIYSKNFHLKEKH